MSEQEKPRESRTPVHLVLSAGGIKCVSYIGAIRVLEKNGIEFKTVSACSAGSLIGALLCAGLSGTQIEKMVLDADFSRFGQEASRLGPLSLFRWPFARYRRSGIPELVVQLIGGDRSFGDLEIPFATAGVDMVADRILVYSRETHPEMSVAEAVRIATAIPGVYPPHIPEGEGRIVVDASLVSQSPVWLATAYPEKFPIVVLVPRKKLIFPQKLSMPGFIGELFQTGVASRDSWLVQHMPRVRAIEIDCGDLRYDEFDLSDDEKSILIASGRQAAEQALRVFGPDLSHRPVASPLLRPGLGSSEDDRAEAHGEYLISLFQGEASRLVRDKVFISYSHEEDTRWLDLALRCLRKYLPDDAIWYDRKIGRGSAWDRSIRRALVTTRAALCLVSDRFLESDYIQKNELSYFYTEAEVGLRIFWVLVSGERWKEDALGRLHAAGDTRRPLSLMTEKEAEQQLDSICREIAESLWV